MDFWKKSREWRPHENSFFIIIILLFTLTNEVTYVRSASFYFTREPKSQDALHGRSAILRCEVSDPQGVVYSWIHNSQTVTNTERRFIEDGNLKFTAIDRIEDSGSFQCVASKNSSGEEERSAEVSFNIKWLESGAVTLKSPESQMDIQSSSQVILRCNIDGHPRPTNRWYKDRNSLTEKSYKINNKERTLTLPSVSPDDNGLYHCCAKNTAGQVCSSDNFTLNIIDKSFPQALVKPESLVVLKNEEAFFNCQFTAEPQPSVEWYHDNELLSNKTRIFILSNGSLFLSQVKQRNTGVYRCVAQGPRGPPVSLEASLILAEIDDMIPRMSKVFTVDSLERVMCRPPRGHPEPEVWWEHEGQRVPAEGRVYQDGLALVFSPTYGEDSGTYMCLAQNKAGQKKQELTVTVATRPEWIEKPVDSQMEEGRVGFLHCHTRATPQPEVTWYRNMQPISAEDVRFKMFSNGSLRINNVEVYDGHLYSCESRTEAGKLHAQARVYVLERLKFTPTPQSSQCLELNKEGFLQCSAKGRPTPSIRWIRTDGSDIPAWVEQQGGTLHFTKVTRTNAGNYTCLAANNLQGEIRAVVQLTVAVFVAFKLKPENTTVYQGHTAVLHCQASGDPPPFIQWKKKDTFLEADKSRFQKMPNGSLVIHDVSTEDTGSYTCIAGNSCNIAHTTAELYVVEKPVQHSLADEEKTPYKMIQTIGLSVGAAVAYIIIVLGLMFYCKQRRNAQRLQKSQDGDERELECLNGDVQQNGHTTAEIQDEMPLANMSSKRHSSHDKLHFPRNNLHTITTLGKGEFGDVLMAKTTAGEGADEEETVVMVKSLQTRDEHVQVDFRRECDMFAKLSHANIARLLGICRDIEPHYMIMEYTDMGDLKQYLRVSKSKDDKVKVQPLSTKQKVWVCLQVARGMEHLSNQRFVHRDLATRNCLISSKRHVKVSALGLSKDVYNSEYYHYRQSWIPLRWLPSEAVCEDDFSTKTDVWSFGVLMWEVFSFGEMPYADLTDDKVLEALQEGKLKPSPPQGCPSRVYKLMAKCWAGSPKDRLSFSDIVTALSDLPSESKV
ncbi:Inactive tyrosine-protein kinase 7 [Triplophysa tibetana]|uniref:Inactive tyrosine-protein kinase 7 n=1 Tax=Triplophysa tibetana TaxID=1572043 RepID=A0A5A9NUB1_9TELE|nr:Inactive tyrosine-protein kinase 7 [Triplophysa tibetana]